MNYHDPKIKPPELHASARAFAEAGLKIFPCLADSKKPACERGFHDATTDLNQIDAWWTDDPNYNIGICPEDAGWCVVDIEHDGEDAWAKLQAEHGAAPDTYEVRTPRGGRHLYFKGSLPATVRKLAPGEAIDTRGRGSYVLVLPSVVDGKPYQEIDDREIAECPGWIAAALAETRQKRAPYSGELDLPGNVDRARRWLEDCVKRGDVAVAGRGGNNRTYQLACELLGLGVSADTALALLDKIWNPHCMPPWGYDELQVTIGNADKYGQAPGANAVAPATEIFAPQIAALGIEAAAAKQTGSVKRSRFYPVGEDEMDAADATRWLIPQLMQVGRTVLMVGETQSYKSFLALDIALAVATGRQTFGVAPSETGPTFYAALEGLHDIKGARRRAWRIAREIEGPIEHFFAMPAPLIATPAECQEFGAEIAKRCGGRKPRLIVLETANRMLAGMNENDAGDAGDLIRFCDSLVEAFGCTVVAIHHKSDKPGASPTRGSSAFNAGFDTVVEVTAHRPTRTATVRVRKHKDAAERETPWTFQGRVVGPSLVFSPTTAAEHRETTQGSDPYARENVGAALRALGAIGRERGVTTMVLATELIPPLPNETFEDRTRALQTAQRRLGERRALKEGARSLVAYAHPGEGDRGATLWYLPAMNEPNEGES